jgi:DNA mismatch repair protein MutL
MSDAVPVPRIHKLSVSLANQIAAGEVIERPASVVKELLENSLDAAANEIEIDIEKAGNRMIRVRDNGQGIHADDLVIALDRHATSKLHSSSDLGQIVSLGFRGEALPSIASVSRLSITSRSAGSENAWSITSEIIDKTPQSVPAAHPVGTSVEVRDLFFNTPGRRKFLKSGKTEFLHIQTLIKHIALSRYGIGIRCHHNGKPVFQYAAADNRPEQRVIDVCGKSFFRQALPLEYEREGLHLWGWVGMAEVTRSQSDRQYFFLNGRIVRDKHVNHAVRMAYQDLIYTGRFPSYVLYLEMDPGMVDVNVHPTKHEVRFREPRNVHDFIFSSIHQVLKTKAIQGNGRPEADTSTAQYLNRENGDNRQQEVFTIGVAATRYPHGPGLKLQGRPDSIGIDSSSGQTLLLCQGRFLIREMQDGPMLIDIHAAREAVIFERLKTACRNQTIRTRPLLVPLTLHVPESEAVFVAENAAVIAKFGFCIDRIGPDGLLVRELPALLPYADAVPLVMDVINILHDIHGDVDAERLVGMMASHANDGAVQTLDKKSIEQLWEDIKWLEQISERPRTQRLYCVLNRTSLLKLIQLES